jgi:cell division protein FtsA
MAARLEEIFEIIREDVERVQMSRLLRAGVVLGGGGSRVKGIVKLAEQSFQMEASVGRISSVNGLASALDQPEFATAIGLVKYGSLRQRKPTAPVSIWSQCQNALRSLMAIFTG